MSGRRRVGSSCGSGLKTISDVGAGDGERPRWAHSRMVHSSGLPMLTGMCSSRLREADDAFDEIGDVAEAAGLRAVAVDGERLVRAAPAS